MNKKIIEYNTMTDMLHDLRSKMKIGYDEKDYDQMLNSWNRIIDYLNACPGELKGSSFPRMRGIR